MSSLEGIERTTLYTTWKTNVKAFILNVNVGCYIYTIVYWIVVRLKTEHHAICATQENIPTTNIYTHIDFNHLDLESTFHKQEIVETRYNISNAIKTIMFKSKSKGTCCTSYLFFFSVLRYEIWREKSDCFGSNKVLIHKEQKEKWRSLWKVSVSKKHKLISNLFMIGQLLIYNTISSHLGSTLQ